MTLGEAVNSVLSKYATFTGRATRAEFWRWVVVFVLLTVVSRIIDGALFGSSIQDAFYVRDAHQPVTSLLILALLLPNMALAVRRLHDIGRSGWWQLIALIPVVGVVVLIVWWARLGDQAPNDWGPNPWSGFQPTR